MTMLRGNHRAYALHRGDTGGALQRFLQETRSALQRTILLGHYDAMNITRQSFEASSVTTGEHERPRVESMFHGDSFVASLRRRLNIVRRCAAQRHWDASECVVGMHR